MKNLNKILLITLLFVGINAVEGYSRLTVKITVARQMDCRGRGICYTVVWVNGMALSKDNDVIATADFNQKKQLTLTFNKLEGMSSTAFEKYFSNGFFICEDDYTLPKEISKALNYEGDYIVPSGKYPVSINNETITVVFDK